MTAYVYAALARLKARMALKRNFSTALLLSFLSDLPSLLAGVFAILSLSSFLQEVREGLLNQGQEYLEKLSLMTIDDVYMQMDHGLMTAGILCFIFSIVLVFLRLSAINSQFKLLRGQDISWKDAFSRVGQMYKAIGLTVSRAVLMILWLLPGIAVTVLGFFLSIRTSGDNLTIAAFGLEITMLLGMSAMVFFGVWAYMRYVFAEYVMADKPETGVFASIREARDLSKGNIRRMLMMLLSFVFWYFLTSFLSGIFSGVIGTVISMALSIIISLYMSICFAALYEQLHQTDEQAKKVITDPDATVQ